ncbi:MAG: hypothetical protein ACLT9Y_05025 [Peptostreptococcus anaerobius]
MASFPVAMTTWLKPGANPDAVTTATPLSFLKLVQRNGKCNRCTY